MTTTEFIQQVIATDYQFDPKSPYYLGFINMAPSDDPVAAVHLNNIIDNSTAFENIFNELGLTIQSAHGDELIVENIDAIHGK
jgi:hypothetical protein